MHFGLSVIPVLVRVCVVGFRDGATGSIAVTWFIVGNLLYYAVDIALAHALRETRAFFKYACRITVPLKLTSRFAVIKIGQGSGVCNDCDACEKTCRMDIRISDNVLNRQRVLSTECGL